MIVIVDYGFGNLRSVQKALESLGFPAKISSKKKEIENAAKIILPGVGAFAPAMKSLAGLGLVEIIKNEIKKGKYLLGVCLGMQLLLEQSTENGPVKGLGIIPGRVAHFRDDKSFIEALVVPHMGWNRVRITRENELFAGLNDGFYAYFVHSYYVNPDNKNVVIGETKYGINYCSALQKDNIYAFQFHPEKSSEVGLKILENFGRL